MVILICRLCTQFLHMTCLSTEKNCRFFTP
nr:MAG TPA: hypothetical protein [Caudoviricetes sp.]